MTAIDDKWQEHPWLGAPVDTGAGSEEMEMPDGRGRARDFENGSIYWTPEHGAHEVHGLSVSSGPSSADIAASSVTR